MFPQIIAFPNFVKQQDIRNMIKIGHGEVIAANVSMLRENLVVNIENSTKFCTLSLDNFLVRNIIRIAESILAQFDNGTTF